jgi:hypothetical protein
MAQGNVSTPPGRHGRFGRIARKLLKAARTPVSFLVRLEAVKPALDATAEVLAFPRCPQRVRKFEDHTFDYNTDFVERETALEKARKSLQQNGILIVKNYFAPEEVQPLASDIAAFVKAISRDIAELREYETEQFVLTHRGGRLQYERSRDKSVVFVRRDDGSTGIDHDEGVIEITNTTLLFPAHRAVYEKISGAFLSKIGGKTMRAGRTLVGRSVAKTRGFHVDHIGRDNRMRYEGVLYLTDVNSLADGPYCFVRGTHINRPLRDINHFINTTLGYGPENDLRVFSQNRIAAALGQAGTALISSMSHGIHRGYPQEPGHSRIALFLD